MGVEVAAALAIGGALAKGINTSKTAKKRDREVARGIHEQGEEQRKANARLNETLKFFEKSNSGDIRDELIGRYTQAIRKKQGQAFAGLDSGGGSSDAFDERASKGKTDSTSRASAIGELFARIDAPNDQRQGERNERIDLGSDLGVFGRNSDSIDYLTKLRVNGIRRNPFLDILSAGLSGAASGAAGGGFGGASKGAQGTIAGSAGTFGPNYGIFG